MIVTPLLKEDGYGCGSELESCGYTSNWVGGRASPVFMSKFGDWFLRLPDGGTHELSVLEGTHTAIAATPEEFSALVNSPGWQEEHLLSLLVQQLHERGLLPTAMLRLHPAPCFFGRNRPPASHAHGHPRLAIYLRSNFQRSPGSRPRKIIMWRGDAGRGERFSHVLRSGTTHQPDEG